MIKNIYIAFFLFFSTAILAQTDTISLKDPFEEFYISISDSQGCLPMQVQFEPSITQNFRFHWDFGDGESSNLAHPTHTYLRAGKYSINMVAYHDKDSIVFSKPDWIIANVVAYPNFNTAHKCICNLPAQITFFNNSHSAANYKWLFEGAEIAEFEGFNPPPIQYVQEGRYRVALIATTEQGCSDTLSIEKYVNVGHKVAFAADRTHTSCAPFPVSFTDQSLGCATKWKWNFGDATPPSFSRDPVHIYSKSGDYTVSLNIMYEDGCTDSLVQNNMIHVGGPLASLQVEPLEVCENEAVNFTFSTSGYLFLEFAPGEVKLLKGLKDEPSYYVHHFKTAGTFRPTYTIIDNEGCLNKFTIQDSIKVLSRPNTDFTASTSFGKKPLTFSLSASKGNEFEYIWAVIKQKDTLTSTEKMPTFTLENAGRYAVQMIAFHPNGCSDTLVKKEFIAILEEGEKSNLPSVPISATIVAEKDGSDDLNITINSIEKNVFSIAIMNEVGTIVSAQMLSVQGLKSTKIKTAELPVGIYNVIVKTSDGKEILQKNFGKNK